MGGMGFIPERLLMMMMMMINHKRFACSSRVVGGILFGVSCLLLFYLRLVRADHYSDHGGWLHLVGRPRIKLYAL